MKKFLMYVVVLVTMLFIGYTTYYFVRNNENIYLALAENDRTIYMNVDESYDLPIVWTKPYSSTKVYENITINDSEVVTFDVKSKKFVAKKGGSTTVVVKPSNTKFGPFTFTISVGDGTVLNPYYISSDLELVKIGKEPGEKWQLTQSYTLTNDIDLRAYDNFEPIGSVTEPFSGTFNGNGYTISNLKITNAENAGLFGATASSAVVENVTLNKPVISGSFQNAGAVVGVNRGMVRLCNVNELSLNNNLVDSVNGGIVGSMLNNSNNNSFVSFGYVDMCSASVTAKTAGTFGGIAGTSIGSVVYNCKSQILKYTEAPNSSVFGGIVGLVQNAQDTAEYMFSIVKNSYAIINKIELSNESTVKAGVIAGINTDLLEATGKNIFKNLYYHSINATLKPVGESNVQADVTTVLPKSMTDLYKQATYVGWDFENVWTIDEDASSAEIMPYTDVVAQPIDEYLPGEEITSESQFMTVLDGISRYPGSGTVYEVTSDVVVDFQNKELQTIAPDYNNPMTASIVCKDGVSVVLKNIKLSGNNSSFFGYISGVNTQIKGLKFENVTINSDAEVVAVVATGVLDNASIQNCEVKNANITTTETTKKLAVVAGVNNGKVSDVYVNNQVADVNTITSSSESLVLGGIVADNKKQVENCTIEMYDFDVTATSTTASLNFGGIVGFNDGNIVNCYNYDTSIDANHYGTVYAGGVAGYTLAGKIVECFSEGSIILPYTNTNSYVGGITAYAGVSTVKQCYYANQTLQGGNVAGIVQTSFANIDQCYFQGEAIGERVAGIVGINNKTVTNCYVLGILTGSTNKSKVSGIASLLVDGSLVDHCFSSATFNGNGSKNAETESEFRATIEKVGQLFNQYPNTGSFKNTIIINYGDANVKGTVFGWIKQGWIKCSDDQAKGITGDYSVFKNNAGFDQNLWTFDNNGGNGAYPTLTLVVKNPRSIVEE